jgi:hypothetical protein
MVKDELGTAVHMSNTLGLAEDIMMWREVDGEVIVLDKRTWTYMGINGSGAVLWKKIAQGADPTVLVECLSETYEIDEQTAARDVDAFLAMMKTHDFLLDEAG